MMNDIHPGLPAGGELHKIHLLEDEADNAALLGAHEIARRHYWDVERRYDARMRRAGATAGETIYYAEKLARVQVKHRGLA